MIRFYVGGFWKYRFDHTREVDHLALGCSILSHWRTFTLNNVSRTEQRNWFSRGNVPDRREKRNRASGTRSLSLSCWPPSGPTHVVESKFVIDIWTGLDASFLRVSIILQHPFQFRRDAIDSQRTGVNCVPFLDGFSSPLRSPFLDSPRGLRSHLFMLNSFGFVLSIFRPSAKFGFVRPLLLALRSFGEVILDFPAK